MGSDAWGDRFRFEPMTASVALTIADTWHYPPPYDFYDGTADADDYHEFVTPALWPELFDQVLLDADVVGFLTAEADGPDAVEIGLGMRPDLTGGGRGSSFVRAVLARVGHVFPRQRVLLEVGAFNQRAIAVYQRTGFVATGRHPQQTNGGTFEFVRMELIRPAGTP